MRGCHPEPSPGPPSELDTVLQEYEDLFSDELDTINDGQVKLRFKDNHKPRFMKARNVFYALREAVESEFKELEALVIITLVASSDFATPVVRVVKRDGSIRPCGDYKVKLNHILRPSNIPYHVQISYF